ncbi:MULTISPECIES: SH3 domain-containing protein [Nostocales]|uniref:SH3 domain-containing protein n=3 Tax=Nostocales TaxID=1161 RepID=A0A8S9TAC3_9CYAN|nr:SH3 domain-containing protein [Tolypothrix bouteillei]KAF3888534.1 SH3 domain-containing protein [Tolypothrix bouteillei VB521301]
MRKQFLFVLLLAITACSKPQVESTTSALPTITPATSATSQPETTTTQSPATPTPTTTEPPVTPTPTPKEEDTTESVNKSATLTSIEPGSRINVRNRASKSAKVRHKGRSGDSVTILSEKTGDDGNTWYRVQVDKNGTKGWVRSDFVTTSTDNTAPLPTSSPSSTGTEENN